MLRDFTKEAFDIIIQAGQSNSAGRGAGPVAAAYVPNGRVWYLNNDFTISVAKEDTEYKYAPNAGYAMGNLFLTFAEQYIQSGRLADNRKLLIVRAAVGGTGFSDHRWRPGDDLFLQMIEMIRTALALNPENRATALLWHQGESDSRRGTGGDVYYKYFTTLIDTVRDVCGQPRLPFVAGEFVPQWYEKIGADKCDPVLNALRLACENIGGIMTSSKGLLSNDQMIGNGDTVHFCRESIYKLGERYFEAFDKLSPLHQTAVNER